MGMPLTGIRFLESLPLDVIHDDVVGAGVRPNVVDCDDTQVVQRARCFGFLHEASVARRIGNKCTQQDLDGDQSVEARIMGLVDHTHAALAELRFDPVLFEASADHRNA
jgi:hypothetical protein